MRNSMLGLAIAAVLVFSLAPGASAQATHTLSGVVTDQDGGPVAGANVSWFQWGEVDCDESGDCGPDGRGHYHERVTTTDADGRFAVSARQGWGDLGVYKEGHASHYEGLEVSGDEDLAIELLRFPDKTARVEGRITPGASISIETPLYGTYECSQGPAKGGSAEPVAEPVAEPAGNSSGTSDARMIAPGQPYPYPGCAITVREDGTYSGNVTPGYSIIRVHGGWSEGGEGHYSHTMVRDLPANATTRIDVALKARPGPDAALSGYAIDGSTQKAIPGAQVSFSNQDSYGWASAQTDGDGSYKVALRSGFVHVQVWADGYLPWEGQVDLASGADRSMDIVLTAGQARHGGCCVAYASGADGAADSRLADSDGMEKSGSPGEVTASQQDDADAPNDFQDLGGGLGPYDPARTDAETGRDSPGPGALAFIGILGLLALARRK